MRFVHQITTGGTGRRQRDVVRLVHDGGDGALSPMPVVAARFASRAARSTSRRAFGEGRRLAGARASRRVQLVFQPRVFSFQSHTFPVDTGPFALRSFEFPTQPRVLSPKYLDWIRGFLISAPTHALVMPEFSTQYKSDGAGWRE